MTRGAHVQFAELTGGRSDLAGTNRGSVVSMLKSQAIVLFPRKNGIGLFIMRRFNSNTVGLVNLRQHFK